MNTEEYLQAKKKGERKVKKARQEHRNPNPVVLDVETSQYENIGILEIPLSQVIGFVHNSRANAFSYDFEPLLSEKTEFAYKWISLFDAQMNEGIHDPVDVIEYDHRFYVEEGNKRVSVLKYLDSPTVFAKIKRVKQKDPSKTYQAFLQFFACTKIYDFDFSSSDGYERLAEYIHQDMNMTWSYEVITELKGSFYRFKNMYHSIYPGNLPMSDSDAFLLYLSIYRYESLLDQSRLVLKQYITNMKKELELHSNESRIYYQMQPEKSSSFHILRKFYSSTRPLKVGFVYDEPVLESLYCVDHETGRIYLNHKFPDQITTDVIQNLNEIDGYDVVFLTGKEEENRSIRLALDHPQTMFFQCGIHQFTQALTYYYGRTYEVKFLMGILAGTLTQTNQIAYLKKQIQNTSECNAFAIGVSMVNPYASIHLYEDQSDIKENCDTLCAFDYPTASDPQVFGLCYLEDNQWICNATPIHLWGNYYEEIITQILKGKWDENPTRALNCWWGLSSHVIDLTVSKRIHPKTIQLVETLKQSIIRDELNPFALPLSDHQNHSIQNEIDEESILTMDWYCDNIVSGN